MKKLITTFCLMAMALVGYSQNCFWHENMEVIDSVTPAPNLTDWAQNTRISHSGIACDSGTVQAGTTTYLESGSFNLTGLFFARLSFWHICRIDFFDAATVEVSTDGGNSWSQLDCSQFDNSCGDSAAFCGQANVFSSATTLDWDPGVPGTLPTNSMWHCAVFNLSGVAGNQPDVRIRFKLEDRNGGGSGGYPGWFIDDICVEAAVCELIPPSIALSGPNPIGTIYNLGPFNVGAAINDASGILSASLTYQVYTNGVPGIGGTIPMLDFGGGLFGESIPAVNDGDSICYSISAVDNSGCANSATYPSNGSCISFTASTGITFPYCDNFDINQLWTDTLVAGTPWQLGQPNTWPGSAHSSPSCWEVGINIQYDNSSESYLYSPVFSFLGVTNAWIEFWANSSCESGWDGVRLEYSIDQAATWNVLGTDVETPPNAINWYNDPQLNSSTNYAWTGSSQDIANTPDWFKAKHTLSVVDNQPSVQFRFVFTSDFSQTDEGFAIDDICIKQPQPQDAGITAVVQPTSEAPAGQCLPVIVTIQNFGSQPITSVDVTYVPSIGSPVTATWTGNLAPGASINDTLPCFSAPAGSFSMCAYTSLSGDGDLSNDTTCFSGTGIPVLTPSNCDDFEAASSGWIASTLGGLGNNWQLGTPAFGATTGAHSGVQAWDINLASGYIDGEDDTLYSPIYDVSLLSNSNISLNFWRNNDITPDQDGLWIEYTIDGGLTWQTLGSVGDINGVNWYNQPNVNFNVQPGWDGLSSGWVKSTYFLNDILFGFTPANIRFRYIFETQFFGTGGTGVSVDDFCVTVPCANDIGLLSAGSANLIQGIALAAGSTDSVQVVLHNYGSSSQTNGIAIYYNIGAGPQGPYNWTGTIPPNGNITIVLPASLYYTVPSGGFNITAWTVFTGDCESSNDTASSPAVGIPTLIPTNCDDFESGNIGWITTVGGNNEWQLGTPAFGSTTGAHTGVNAWDINLTSGYLSDENDTLFSPIYDVAGLGNSNLSLSFWRNHNTVAQDDGYWVEFTVDGGINWATLGAVADLNSVNWYNQANLDFNNQAAFDGNSGGWVKSTYFLNDILSALNPPTIRFRIIFYASQFGFGGGTGVSIDDFCVTVPCANDLGLFATQSVNTANGVTMPAGSTDSIQVTIHNYGTATQNSFNIFYSINGGTPVGPVAYTGSPIPPNGTVTFILPPTYTVPSSQFNIGAWVALTGDCEPANDSAHATAVGVPTIVIDYNNPYCDDFENGNIGWTTSIDVGGDPGSVWELGAPNFGATSTTHSGLNAWDVNLNTSYTNQAAAVLTSPIFDLSQAVDTKVDFWQNVQSESGWDGTRLEYRIGGSGPWTVLGTAPCDTAISQGAGINWYNDIELNSSLLPAWTINPFGAQCANPTGWFRSVHGLPAACNNQPNVQLRYIFTSDLSVLVDGYSIDDFCMNVPVPLTVAPVNITKAGTVPFIFPGQAIQFRTKILNDGTTPIDSLRATLWIDNSPPTSVDAVVLATTIAPNGTYNYNFANTWIATPGIHNVCASTSFPNGGVDLKPLGDTVCTSIQVFDSAIINNSQRCYDFESGPQWVTCNPYDYSPTSSFQLGNTPKLGGPHAGSNAWFTDLIGDYVGWDSSALYSPLFVVNGGLTYNLNFWTNFKTEKNEDGGTVEYSTDYGQNWSQLGNSFDPNWMNSYSITALSPVPPPISAGWSGNSSGWINVNHDICLPFQGQQNLLFRWRFHSDFSLQDEGWAIDDACFELKSPIVTCVTGVQDLPNQFSLVQNSPNPFSDVTTISFTLTEKGNTQLQIVDISGKIIATPVNANMNAGNYTVNVNAKDLAGGIYFYTLTHNNSQITKKMVVAK